MFLLSYIKPLTAVISEYEALLLLSPKDKTKIIFMFSFAMLVNFTYICTVQWRIQFLDKNNKYVTRMREQRKEILFVQLV